MILGIGTDIIEIKHFKSACQKSPTLFDRLFTKKEQEKALRLSGPQKLAYYAKRFAAKEACSKAIGTGIGADIGWLDMEILNNNRGAPSIKFSSKLQRFLIKKFKCKNIRAFLSLTDEKEYAMAFIILIK